MNKSTLAERDTTGVPNYLFSYKLSDNSLLNINVLDTSGFEAHKSVIEIYYKKADCCILVYDITNRKNLMKLKNILL